MPLKNSVLGNDGKQSYRDEDRASSSSAEREPMVFDREYESGDFVTHRRSRYCSVAYQIIGVAIGITILMIAFAYFLRAWTTPRQHPAYLTPPKVDMVDKVDKMNYTGKVTDLVVPPKPSGFDIVGVVFYGRREFVDILDCYLKQNLAVNGGYLDRVEFMVHTDNQDDLQWLEHLIADVPEYKRIDIKGDWRVIWNEHMNDVDTMYIKMDDDTMFVAQDTVPLIVNSLMEHPESIAISAGAINSPEGNWLHYHGGAVLPFLPETADASTVNLTRSSEQVGSESWRTSELPMYRGPVPKGGFVLESDVPYDGHRWLPLADTSHNLHRTPIAQAEYEAVGRGWASWEIAAQQHYSLLAHLERHHAGDMHALDRFRVGGPEGIWNMQYERYSINFVAVWGSTVAATPVGGADDEHELTIDMPTRTDKPFLVNTKALVAHFGFGVQQPKIRQTDLLSRYRAYANEMVCAKDNQKTSLGVVRERL